MNFILKCSRTAWSVVCGGVHQKEEDLGVCVCVYVWAYDQIKEKWVQYGM